MDQFLELVSWKSGFPHVSLSLSLFLSLPPSPFLAEFPSGARRLAKSTYLPQLLSSLRERAQGGALSNIQTGASGPTLMVQISCPEILLDFPVNQVIQPLFSTEISYYTISS